MYVHVIPAAAPAATTTGTIEKEKNVIFFTPINMDRIRKKPVTLVSFLHVRNKFR